MENEEAPIESFASPKDKLILVVDDDKNIRYLFETYLVNRGFQVVMATDGLDATSKLEKKVPDLVVADLMMPGQSGYEFMRSLPGLGAGATPIFVITGSALDFSTVDMIKREAGVSEFFSKPVKMGHFIAAVHRTLKTKPPSTDTQSRGINDRL